MSFDPALYRKSPDLYAKGVRFAPRDKGMWDEVEGRLRLRRDERWEKIINGLSNIKWRCVQIALGLGWKKPRSGPEQPVGSKVEGVE